MKRILFFLLALALPLAAAAQHDDHVSVGVGAGTDGLSAEFAIRVGNHIDIRTGYNRAFGLVGINIQGVSVPEHPGMATSSSVAVPLNVRLAMNDAHLLMNIYPSETGSFHFTVGAYMGSQRFARGTLSGMPSDYNTVGFDVDGYLVKATGGMLDAYLGAKGIGSPDFAFKPFVGIGFGRAVSTDRKFSFVFDLGAAYQGKPTLWATGEGLTGRLQDVQIPVKDLGDAGTYIDKYAGYLAFWPVLNFHVYVNLF